MVEFALVLPILLLFIAAAADLGRLFYAYVAVDNAAKEGAFFGARSPLCDTTGANGCSDPNNVLWHVQNEAPNLVDSGGNSLFTTSIACRTPAGVLVQPINDCLDGYSYLVTVSYPFQLVTPILSNIIGPQITLSSTSQTTVISDAFDPSGLELLVWTSSTGADNASAIAAACTQADASGSPGFYYQPCQDGNNVDNYLSFKEGATISYKVRVKNTGNINLTSISYGFTENGSSIATPGTCGSLPSSLNAGAAPAYCTFTRTGLVTNAAAGNDAYTIGINGMGQAGGLQAGTTNGASTVYMVPKPRLAINVLAAPYRLGGTGNGTLGLPTYPASASLTLNRDTASGFTETQNPTGWFYLTVANQGGPATGLSVTVKLQGSTIALPAACVVPSSLAASGQPGSTFSCIFPLTFTATQSYTITASASATNALIVSGQQPTVTLSTSACTGNKKVVPNLVDTLTPSADSTSKTVGQARTAWTAAGLTGAVTTNPAGQLDAATSITQDQTAYSCANANTNVTVGAQ